MTAKIESFVMHCGEMGSRWGFNRTVGQMYGLLIIHNESLTAVQISEALNISRGNVSMGIKELQSWRLVQVQHKPKDRKEYYSPAGSIWEMASRVFEERRKREVQNTIWWIEYLGLSGIRMDTYPYSDANFMTQWTCAIRAAYPHLNICGEEWSLNPAVLAYWQEGQNNRDGYTSCLPGLLDFPLHHAFMQCMNGEETWHSDWVRLYEMLGNDFLYPDPFNHIVFPDNHDMSRVHTQLGDDARKTRLAMVFFATTRGIPQFYYGTEILMSNTGDDSHGNIRSDFPGGWSGDEINGFTGSGLSQESLEFQAFTRRLLNWLRYLDSYPGRKEVDQESQVGHIVRIPSSNICERLDDVEGERL